MGRQKLTDEERASRREARLEKAHAKRAEQAAEREQLKAVIRSEIEKLACVIPPRVREGDVRVVRTWKEALDAAAHDATIRASSVDRLTAARDALKKSMAD